MMHASPWGTQESLRGGKANSLREVNLSQKSYFFLELNHHVSKFCPLLNQSSESPWAHRKQELLIRHTFKSDKFPKFKQI